ncbi:MAG: M20/M25/M40 family metallo-hydrolase [Prevotellaceae bacterium]|jgi:Zn-dependent M28 family amino/carboxypeptidase|nr:M20/M25/M40 family metallo-hydrolase [Prevotellaceae bacterium]
MKKILLLILLLSGTIAGVSQNAVCTYDFLRHLNYLASDSMQGRLPGSHHDSLAATYIRSELLAYGYKPLFENGRQQFPCDAQSGFSHNVVMLYMPDNGTPATETIVLGAHFDHVGHGEYGRRGGSFGEIYNGADDNASGVAMMLELAKKLAGNAETSKRNIMAVAFSAEEQGLVGSEYFVRHVPPQAQHIVLMVNFDMVGRLDSLRNFYIGGIGTFAQADSMLHAAPNPDSLRLNFAYSGTGPSDHTSFYDQDIPILFLFTGLHDDYHTPADDVEKINIHGMHAIARFVEPIIQWAVTSTEPPVFQTVDYEHRSDWRKWLE